MLFEDTDHAIRKSTDTYTSTDRIEILEEEIRGLRAENHDRSATLGLLRRKRAPLFNHPITNHHDLRGDGVNLNVLDRLTVVSNDLSTSVTHRAHVRGDRDLVLHGLPVFVGNTRTALPGTRIEASKVRSVPPPLERDRMRAKR